jgi:cytochrome P450
VYASGVFGDPSLITVIDPDEHRILRKALSNAPWTIGQMKRIWEPRFDDRVNLFIEKMNEHSLAKRTISFADKLGEFALDIMSMISFTEPFGNVESQTDVKGILSQ